MLEGYVVAEVTKILVDADDEGHGSPGGSMEYHKREERLGKIARLALPQLDAYFKHRLGVEQLKTERFVLEEKVLMLRNQLDALGENKASNDSDYLKLSGELNVLIKTLAIKESFADFLLEKLLEERKKRAV
jgi:hypothetical protein